SACAGISLAGGGPAFQAPLAFTRHFTFPLFGALASDRGGHFRAIFTNSVSRRLELFETRSDDGRSWTDPAQTLGASGQPTQDAASIAVDEDGGLHAVWCDTRSGAWLTYAADAPPIGDFGDAQRVSEVEGVDDIQG